MFFRKPQKPLVFENPEDYFPYIGHRLDQYPDRMRLRKSVIGPEPISGPRDTRSFERIVGAVGTLDVDIHPDNFAVTDDPNSVNILLPRHRSLYDFAAFQPLHHDFINSKIMILAGENLFVGKLNRALRCYGGFVFLRDDAVLSCEDRPKAFLEKDFYFKSVLPGYLNREVFCGGKDKHDLMIFLEYEKDARTGKNNGGRSKTGELRQLNWAMFKFLYDLAIASGVKTYITPVNIGFSKLPDAAYIVHPPGRGGANRALRYFFEQRFCYIDYPAFTDRHQAGKLRAVSRYGRPELLNRRDFASLRSYKRFADEIRFRIGELETVFPVHIVCKAMSQNELVNLKTLEDKLFHHHEYLKKRNVRFVDVEDGRGNLLPAEELAERVIRHLNANPRNLVGAPEKGLKLFSLKKNYLRCHDLKLQLWYANNILHFEKQAEDFYV